MYSQLKHIARSIWLSRYRANNSMAMFSVYFDASGKPNNRVVTVAGAVSTIKKWVRFESEWKAILTDAGVKTFHATDFAASLGEFEGWKGKRERRSKFLHDLGEAIRRNVNKMFAISVEMSAWESVDQMYHLKETIGSPVRVVRFRCGTGLPLMGRAQAIQVASRIFF